MKRFLIILLILVIGGFLRFYQLGINPPSLTWDEVAWGYNAYSLGIDGQDEFGKFLPYAYLESFGDFKPPMYAYLDILPIRFFGLNEFATRFPSAFFGTLVILVTYFLTKRIFSPSKYAEQYGLLSSLLLAISPWHIMLSRAAFEANVASFFLITGIWLFLEAIERQPWFLSFSAISFVFSVYTFNTTRIVSPLIIIVLALLYWRKLLGIKKQVIAAAFIGILLILPTLPFLFSPQAKLRFAEVNIFSDPGVVKTANQEIQNDNNAVWSKLLHNRRVGYTLSYLSHYFDNLSPQFLFITGDGNPKFSIQSMGQMYLWELPFLIAGILFLFKKRESNWKILPLWLLLAIVPAATARETPHALRIETTLPTFQILVAYGVITVIVLLNKLRERYDFLVKGVYAVVVYVALFNFSFYLEDYYTHYATQFSAEWQYGYRDAIQYANEVRDQYGAIYLTDAFGRPYIYTLFYTKYDPKLFRKEAVVHREALGFVTVQSFDSYYFGRDLISKNVRKQVLYIDVPKDVPNDAIIKKKFYFVDGSVALVAYTL